MTDTFDDGYRQGVETATNYLRGVADWFFKRDDTPASLAEVPAFLARIAKDIDVLAEAHLQVWAESEAENNTPPRSPDKSLH
jgi:hypothetical protein